MRARGMRYEYRRQPRHMMHKEDPLDRGREIVKKKEKAEKGRNGGGGGGGGGGGSGEDAASVRRGQYLREGLGSASFSHGT